MLNYSGEAADANYRVRANTQKTPKDAERRKKLIKSIDISPPYTHKKWQMYTVKYYNIARLFMREFMHDGQPTTN